MTEAYEILCVIFIAIFAFIGMFIVFLVQHERERKKKIHKTRTDDNIVGQLDKFGDDVT